MKVKFVNKSALQKINKHAIRRKYNRSIDPAFLEELPADLNFPITFCMEHNHAAGEAVEPHMRCRILLAKTLTGPYCDVFLDIDMRMYDILPEADVPDMPDSDTKTDLKKIKAKSGIPTPSVN